jgi:hypothetical protein
MKRSFNSFMDNSSFEEQKESSYTVECNVSLHTGYYYMGIQSQYIRFCSFRVYYFYL